MSYSTRSRLMLKLAAKHYEQNVTIWEAIDPSSAEEDAQHSVLSEVIPLRSDDTEDFYSEELAAKHDEQNGIICKADHQNTAEVDVDAPQHSGLSEGVPIRNDNTEVACSEMNDNHCHDFTYVKGDEDNSAHDFDSDDSVVDPSFVIPSSCVAKDSNETAGKRKVLYPCNKENISRKRKKNVQNWRKNESKLLRNCGKSYKSIKKIKHDDGTIERTEVTRDARKLKPPCEEKCRLKCSEKISEQERQNIFDEYWKMANLQRQRDFIAARMTTVNPKYRYQREDSHRRHNTAFYFDRNSENVRVCKQFFTATLGISARMVRTVEEKRASAPSGFISTDFRGKHGNHATVPTTIKERIRKHISSIPKIPSHYCRARTSKEYIPGDKTISDLYRDYKKTCEEENIEYGNYLMYYTIFNQEFNLSFYIPKNDKCELCVKYENSSNEEKEKLTEEYETHLLEKDLARIEKENDKKSNNIVAVYDLQAVLPCPQGDASTFYYVSKLNVFNFTIFQLQTNDVHCYVWHEGQANRGSIEIASCVWRYLEQLHRERANEPVINNEARDVIFYSDNCAGQNKNKNIISMYRKAILTFKWIRSISHKYLITGHSQNEGDSAHSNIEKQIKKARKSGPIYVPDHYVSLIRSAKKTGKPYAVHELCYDDFYNFQNHGIEIYKKNTDKETFKISDVKIFKIDQNKPNELLYKNSYGEHDFQTVSLTTNLKTTRRKSDATNQELRLEKAYTTKTGITEAKKIGLLRLIDKTVIPKYYSDFYNSL